MTTSKSMQPIDRKRIVVKLGGSMLSGLSSHFFTNFKRLQAEGYDILIVHGGGAAINAELAKHDIQSTIIEGIRVTCEDSAQIVRTVLIGSVNPLLVHQLNREGIVAIGLNGFDGKLFTCDYLNKGKYGFVGDIKSVNKQMIDRFIDIGVVPVFSCIGSTECGMTLNINADTMASKVALAVEAESLLFVTDTPGIHIAGTIQRRVSVGDIVKWLETEDIYGGMIPKVKAALDCIREGIPSVRITDQHLVGTVIEAEGVFS
ncbi:acetylglutamate kinase [Sporosarcina sp. Te-1]|uniref:acetylglutamate kinase n=1 Tax=Sporosarcina sp. Te-1 TaxID=2818390 RepID=UPI001A9EFBD7|nr:acetylglutamate kinase [Sporosarcina sp. Te-1]QTD42602.1 acetylglutamate kinase [Sporosarcina sp. Te-1]